MIFKLAIVVMKEVLRLIFIIIKSLVKMALRSLVEKWGQLIQLVMINRPRYVFSLVWVILSDKEVLCIAVPLGVSLPFDHIIRHHEFEHDRLFL